MTIIMFLLGLLLIFTFGYKLSRILLPKVYKLEQIALGYVLGVGIFTFIWFLINWAGIPYNLTSGFGVLIVLNTIVYISDRLFNKKIKEKYVLDLTFFKKLNVLEKILLGIIVFLSVSALIQTIYWPIRYWDSLVLYDFRAKIFAATGNMQDVIASSYFLGYPLLTSLGHAWVYILGGSNPSFLYSIYYISLLVVIFFNIRKLNLGTTLSLFLTSMVALSPRLFDHTQWAYTNLPYSIYIILGSIYLYFGIKKKDLGSYIISALLISLSTWTRTAEPFWLSCVITAVVFSFFIRKWFWPLIYASVVASIMLPWRVFQGIYNLGTVNVASQVASTSQGVVQSLQFSILKPAFDFVMANVVNMYLIYFVLLGIILLIKLFTKSKEWLFASLIILDLGLTFAGTLIFVKDTVYWQDIPDSLARMVMFVPVLILFLSAELLSEIKKS